MARREEKTCALCGRVGTAAFRPYQSVMGGHTLSLWMCSNRAQCDRRFGADLSGRNLSRAMEVRAQAFQEAVSRA